MDPHLAIVRERERGRHLLDDEKDPPHRQKKWRKKGAEPRKNCCLSFGNGGQKVLCTSGHTALCRIDKSVLRRYSSRIRQSERKTDNICGETSFTRTAHRPLLSEAASSRRTSSAISRDTRRAINRHFDSTERVHHLHGHRHRPHLPPSPVKPLLDNE